MKPAATTPPRVERTKRSSWLALHLLLAALLTVALAGCGDRRDNGYSAGGTDSAPSAAVAVKSGVVATDSWGYTGSSPLQVASPAPTAINLAGRTLLVDDSRTSVSGELPSTVSYSQDLTTLSAAAQGGAPSGFLCWLDLSVGSARTTIPAFTMTVDLGTALAGATVNAYAYDSASRKWTFAQSAVVSDTGKATFTVSGLALWGIFQTQ